MEQPSDEDLIGIIEREMGKGTVQLVSLPDVEGTEAGEVETGGAGVKNPPRYLVLPDGELARLPPDVMPKGWDPVDSADPVYRKAYTTTQGGTLTPMNGHCGESVDISERVVVYRPSPTFWASNSSVKGGMGTGGLY